jgi:hypothetical protein
VRQALSPVRNEPTVVAKKLNFGCLLTELAFSYCPTDNKVFKLCVLLLLLFCMGVKLGLSH